MPSERKTQPTRMRMSRMANERRRRESCGNVGIAKLMRTLDSNQTTHSQKRSPIGGNVSNKLSPSSAREIAAIRLRATVFFRHRHSKIPHVKNQIRKAVVVTPERGPVGL